MIRSLLPLSTVLLAGCVPVVVPVPLPAAASVETRPKIELIGRDPEQVTALLGSPGLDRTEGPARQLQFANATCVLDVFFYPDRRSGRVAATHVEARTRTGQVYDAAACAESLSERG